MARYRHPLEETPGLAATRLCFTAELDTFAGGTPRLAEWALLCGWETSEARDAFLGDPARLRPFLAGARESWSVSLESVRAVMGDWHGWTPSSEGVAPLDPDEPLAVITYARVRTRYLPLFTWHNRIAVRELAPNPGHVMRLGFGDSPMARGTFSLWRSRGEMVRFAYGTGLHNPIQRRSLDAPWGEDYFFARFRPVASSGTWGGRDPLAELDAGGRGPQPVSLLD